MCRVFAVGFFEPHVRRKLFSHAEARNSIYRSCTAAIETLMDIYVYQDNTRNVF